MLLVITLHSNGKIDLNSDDVGATGRAVELIHGPDPDRSPLREVASRVHDAGHSLPSDLQEVFDRADQAGLAAIGFTHVALVTLEHPTATRVVPIIAPAEPQPIGDLSLADLYSLYRDGSRTRTGIDCYEMMPAYGSRLAVQEIVPQPTELLIVGFVHEVHADPAWPRAASGLAIVATGRTASIGRHGNGGWWAQLGDHDRAPGHLDLHTTADLERVIAWTRGA